MVGGTTNETWLGSLVPGPSPRVAAPHGGGLTEVPERIGPYEVEELVGRGGMAAVYRCRDEAGDVVAVKWLHQPSPALEQRFALEIRALARIQHSAVVRWLGQGSHRGRPYLVMEYLQGEDLRLWTHRARRLPPVERRRRVRRLAALLCEALAHLHRAGLVHRDVKPSNVLVLDHDLPVLTDFGVVKDLADDGATAVGVVIGTLNYASPEQLRGDPVDPRTDLYGLGCTLYYMLTGRVPFEQAEQAELVLAHLTRPPVPPSHHDPTIPADLEQVVLRLLAKVPDERYASAGAVAAALSATPAPAGVPLAGRKRAVRQIAEALELVGAGHGCVVQVTGRPGTGKGWVSSTLQEGAARRDLPFLEPHEPAALEAALARLGEGEALLVVTELPVAEPDVQIRLGPLRRADIRRSVVAAAPDASDTAALAERLYRATGGLPVLLLPLLERLDQDPRALDGPLPAISVDRWLDPLDLDCIEVLQAVAVAPGPLSAAEIEAITQVPAEEPLRALLDAGLLVAARTGPRKAAGGAHPGRYGRRYGVAADAFAVGALGRAPDVDALRERTLRIAGPRAPGAGPLALPGLRQVHELLVAGDLASAQLEVLALEAEHGLSAQPSRQAGVRLARARLDWLSGRASSARTAFSDAAHQAQVGGRGHITAQLGLGVLEQQLGRPEQALELLEAASVAAHNANELDLEAMAAVQLTWGRALAGRPGPALKRCRELAGVARALAQPVLECVAMEVQGRLLLEVGLPDDASRVLADISALAHAAGLARERWQAHVLRARATLDRDPASPTVAAAATDRLLRVLGEPPAPDPLGYTALAHALLARAAARLSDARTCRAARTRALDRLGRGVSPTALIARLQLARASWVSGDAAEARATIGAVERDAAELGYGFLAWQARKLDAAMRGAEPEDPHGMLEGMEPSWAAALTREGEPG
jgi:hypothetical protein